MGKKVAKKVDVKKVSKLKVSEEVSVMLGENGIGVEDGTLYGFTEGTLVAHLDKCDIQIKLIAPKAGVDRYIKLEEEEEDVEPVEE